MTLGRQPKKKIGAISKRENTVSVYIKKKGHKVIGSGPMIRVKFGTDLIERRVMILSG